MGFNQQLAQLPEDDFMFAMKNGVRKSVLLDFDFMSLIYNTFGFVKDRLPELINKGDFEQMVFECFRDRDINVFSYEIDRIPSNDLLHFLFWIKDELALIARLESEYLSADPDIDLIAAGINEMNQFGDLNTVDAIVRKYNYKHDEVMKMKYNFVFDLQLKSAVEARIEKKLVKIKSKSKK